MEVSQRIEKMLAPYGFEIARKFFDSFNIYHFVDKFANVQKGSCIRLRVDGREYGFDDHPAAGRECWLRIARACVWLARP